MLEIFNKTFGLSQQLKGNSIYYPANDTVLKLLLLNVDVRLPAETRTVSELDA